MYLKFINLSFTYIKITIITVVMQTQAKFYLCFTNVHTNFFSALPTLSVIPLVGPLPNTEKLLFSIMSMR